MGGFFIGIGSQMMRIELISMQIPRGYLLSPVFALVATFFLSIPLISFKIGSF